MTYCGPLFIRQYNERLYFKQIDKKPIRSYLPRCNIQPSGKEQKYPQLMT